LTYPPDDRSIESQAQTNFQNCITETKMSLVNQQISPFVSFASHNENPSSSRPLPPLPFSAYARPSEPEHNYINKQEIGVNLESLIQSGIFTLKVVGLRKNYYINNSLSTLDLQLKADATLDDIMAAITDAGASF
jgi:hypothetical protein